MLVKLTEKGRVALGKNKDQRVVNVADNRAFALMEGGYANRDHGFMSWFAAANFAVPVELIKKKIKPKIEKAISRKAEKREKAIMR